MFNFRAAVIAMVTLTAFAGLVIGIAFTIAAIIDTNLTYSGAGIATLIVSISLIAGLSTEQ